MDEIDRAHVRYREAYAVLLDSRRELRKIGEALETTLKEIREQTDEQLSINTFTEARRSSWQDDFPEQSVVQKAFETAQAAKKDILAAYRDLPDEERSIYAGLQDLHKTS